MAKMGSRKHLKRYKAPKSWPIHPKEDTWTVKPAPGSHAIEDSLPLLVIIRDILGLADNSREAKRIMLSPKLLQIIWMKSSLGKLPFLKTMINLKLLQKYKVH